MPEETTPKCKKCQETEDDLRAQIKSYREQILALSANCLDLMHESEDYREMEEDLSKYKLIVDEDELLLREERSAVKLQYKIYEHERTIERLKSQVEAAKKLDAAQLQDANIRLRQRVASLKKTLLNKAQDIEDHHEKMKALQAHAIDVVKDPEEKLGTLDRGTMIRVARRYAAAAEVYRTRSEAMEDYLKSCAGEISNISSVIDQIKAATTVEDANILYAKLAALLQEVSVKLDKNSVLRHIKNTVLTAVGKTILSSYSSSARDLVDRSEDLPKK